MSTKTILYFLADNVPTEAEAADITILNTLASGPYNVRVINGKPRVSKSATTISAAASDNSYNDSGSGFITAGFAVGDIVDVSGFTGNTANNVNSATVTALTAGKMTIGGTDGDVIVDDAAGETVKIQTASTATYGGIKIVGDYALGTIPNSYLNGSTAYYTAFSVAAPPRPDTLIATQTVVTSAQEIAITSGTGTTKVTLTIAAGTITACVLS